MNEERRWGFGRDVEGEGVFIEGENLEWGLGFGLGR
jgi:hypothetical protein